MNRPEHTIFQYLLWHFALRRLQLLLLWWQCLLFFDSPLQLLFLHFDLLMLLFQLFLFALQFLQALLGHVHAWCVAHLFRCMLAGLWEVSGWVEALRPEVLREKFMVTLER